MGERRSERDDRIVATISELWSAYQRGEVSIELVARQLYGLSESLEGDVDTGIRRALPTLARDVELLSATAGPEAGDRRLADLMNRFLIDVGEEPVRALHRPELVALLAQFHQGAMSLDAIRAVARRTWLAGLRRPTTFWPTTRCSCLSMPRAAN